MVNLRYLFVHAKCLTEFGRFLNTCGSEPCWHMQSKDVGLIL